MFPSPERHGELNLNQCCNSSERKVAIGVLKVARSCSMMSLPNLLNLHLHKVVIDVVGEGNNDVGETKSD